MNPTNCTCGGWVKVAFCYSTMGLHLSFDPYLSDSLSIKYANTDKPHTRISERVIDPARLTMIDVVDVEP